MTIKPEDVNPEPSNYEDAMQLALDWAVGRRDSWEVTKHHVTQEEPGATVGMMLGKILDEITAIKWAQVAQAMAAPTSVHAVLTETSIDVDRLRRSLAQLDYSELTSIASSAAKRAKDIRNGPGTSA